MSEWDYASLSRTASEHGGPEKYINEVAETNYLRGVEDERGTEWWKIGLGIAVFEVGKAGVMWTINLCSGRGMKHGQKRGEVAGGICPRANRFCNPRNELCRNEPYSQ